MAALDDYYTSFLAKLNEKTIDTARLKRLADRCATDSPLRKVLLEPPDKISRMDILGFVHPLSTLAKREDRVRRET